MHHITQISTVGGCLYVYYGLSMGAGIIHLYYKNKTLNTYYSKHKTTIKIYVVLYFNANFIVFLLLCMLTRDPAPMVMSGVSITPHFRDGMVISKRKVTHI